MLTIGFGPAAAQQKVGISGAVNPDVRGTPPGAAARQLVIGQDVVFNERITSAAEGQTQIVFLDESTMTVGPNSDLVIDQFVYDPRSGTGRLAMSATRGLLRYVGGKLSKQDGAVTLRTSTATLAVRGGAFIANLRPNGSLDVIFLYGAGLTVSSLPAVQRAAISQTITRPGFEISVGPDGQMSPPHPVPPGLLAQLLQQLDGRPNGTGGLAVVPTGATVVNSGIGQVISGNISDSIIQSIQNSAAGGLTTVTTAAQSFGGPNPNLTLTLNNIDSQFSTAPSQVIDCVTTGACNPANTVTVATTASGQPIGGSGSISPTPPPPTPTNFSGRLKNTNGGGTTFGFVDQSANGDIPYAGGQLVNGVF
ncbi:MAG TPA: FecR domain-containing protein, partial [Stellaceae bacterium]|nr:FecR domain-containing protein [Stellaceae bacterium]